MHVREDLDRLLHGGVDEGTNVDSALVGTVTNGWFAERAPVRLRKAPV